MSYRPVELRAYLEQAKVERRSARIQDVKWQRPGAETVWFEIHVNPLVDAENGLLGVSIVFFDVTATRALLDKVVQTNRQLEAAYEELQSTNEELETTNEELQSTVEELETTNEELQSTNEELETMNEELQSTNDELHTINDMLRERSLGIGRCQKLPGFADRLGPHGHGRGGPRDEGDSVEPRLRRALGAAGRRDDRDQADHFGHRTAVGKRAAADRQRVRRGRQLWRDRSGRGQPARAALPGTRHVHVVSLDPRERSAGALLLMEVVS